MNRALTALPDVENRLQHLNAAAIDEFEDKVQRYADDLVREAERLEATQRTTSGDPEITSTMVSDANTLLRRAYVRPRRSRLTICLQVVAYAGAIGAGVGVTGLDATWGQLTFVISAVSGILGVAVIEIRK